MDSQDRNARPVGRPKNAIPREYVGVSLPKQTADVLDGLQIKMQSKLGVNLTRPSTISLALTALGANDLIGVKTLARMDRIIRDTKRRTGKRLSCDDLIHRALDALVTVEED